MVTCEVHTYYTCFVNQSLMKIEIQINEISSKVLSKVNLKRTRSTRSSHNSQSRPQTYSDALKYSFSPRTIPHRNSLAPTVVAAEIRALI